jgi:hypothetical protein
MIVGSFYSQIAMAPFSRLLLAVAALLLVTVTGEAHASGGQARYDRVFSFGDSLTDTGNSAILPATAGGPFTNPPYGETYFKRPNGRASDGRLVIDFIGMSNHSFWLRFHLRALTCIIPDHEFLCLRIYYTTVESLRLPQPAPYLAGSTADDFRHGVNFAVGGATALDMDFLQSKGITSFVPVFLSNQTTWFNGVLQLLASARNSEYHDS